MRKVLVADDEFVVRLGLKSIINWELAGFTIVAEARNGKEALEYFEEFLPDVVLTDIRMPVMDGLALIERLKERKPSVKAVILTHYDDFAYAQEALKLGASDYLLKPDLSPETLLKVLGRLSEQLDLERGSDAVVPIKAQDRFEHLARCLELALAAVETGKVPELPSLGDLGARNPGFLGPDQAVMVFGRIEDRMDDLRESPEEIIRRNLPSMVQEHFSGKGSSPVVALSNHHLIILASGPGLSRGELVDWLGILVKNAKQYLDIELSLGISLPSGVADGMSSGLAEAKSACDARYFNLKPVQFLAPVVTGGAPAKVDLGPLKAAMERRDSLTLPAVIDAIFDAIVPAMDRERIHEVFTDILGYARLKRQELADSSGPSVHENKFSYANFQRLTTLEAVKAYLRELLTSLVTEPVRSSAPNYSATIRKTVEFINSHYSKSITLSDAADHVEISKSYLSFLFKQETGINFISHLNNHRVQMAKQLLVETNLKLYEIAERVGFENPYYFSKVFRELAGVSCKEYRDHQTA